MNELIQREIVPLGNLNGHAVYVSMKDIIPEYVAGKRRAIVISHFVEFEDPPNEYSRQGALGRAMQEKLQAVSERDSLELKRLFDEITRGKPGDVHEVVLNIPRERYSELPIDRLYLVLFERGVSSYKLNLEALSRAMPSLMKQASDAQISTLIVPALGYNQRDKNSIHFADIVRPLFRSLLGTKGTPKDIYIMLYEPWPTYILEDALKDINTEWKRIKSEIDVSSFRNR